MDTLINLLPPISLTQPVFLLVTTDYTSMNVIMNMQTVSLLGLCTDSTFNASHT